MEAEGLVGVQSSVEQEALKAMAFLPEEEKLKVLEYIDTLATLDKIKAHGKGTPGKNS